MGRGRGCRTKPPPSKSEINKNKDFVDTIVSKVLRDLRFSLNQAPKLADD